MTEPTLLDLFFTFTRQLGSDTVTFLEHLSSAYSKR